MVKTTSKIKYLYCKLVPQTLTRKLFDVFTFALQAFVDAHRGFPMKRQTVVTCIATLKKSHDEEKAVSCLILGEFKLFISNMAIQVVEFSTGGYKIRKIFA